MMPKVSVIIPTHKPSDHLLEAINSVCLQTFKDWELLVVADGVVSDLSEFRQLSHRIRIVHQAKAGVSVARNRGIMEAQGEFIAFLDHDDIWLQKKLDKQVAVMEQFPKIALAYCNLETFASGAETPDYSRQKTTITEDAPATIHLDSSMGSRLYRSVAHFSRRFCVPSTVMIRRSVFSSVGLLDPLLPFTGDYDLLIRLGSVYPVAELPSKDVLYRVHADNFSKQYDTCRAEVSELTRRYRSRAKLVGDRDLYRDAKRLFSLPGRTYAAHAIDRSRGALRDRQFGQFIYHLARGTAFDPVFAARSLHLYLDKKLSAKSRTN